MTTITLEYIGKSPVWIDNAYGSGIAFEKGEIYKLPYHIAVKLLRHSDCFQETIGGTTSSGEYDDSAIKRRLFAVESDLSANTKQDAVVLSRLDVLENREDKDTVYDDEVVLNRLTVLENRINNNIVFDDTEIKNRLTALEDKRLMNLYDFTQSGNWVLPAMTSQASVVKIDVTLPDDVAADWKVAALAKYQLLDSNNKRIEAPLLYAFSMDGQKALRVAFRAAGVDDVTATVIKGALLLTHRADT